VNDPLDETETDEPPMEPRAVPKSAGRIGPKKIDPPVREAVFGQEEAPTGVLSVSSSPPGLLVEVDGRSVDLTPTKVKLDPGSHTVALFRGKQRLYERRVDLPENGVSTIDVDVSAQLRVAQAFEAEPERQTPASASASVARGTGELHITSVGLPGDVWINGHPYGPPPLIARRLPVGAATVEIKVKGVARWHRQVDVIASRRTSLEIR
jgi:hypothetical protein